MSSSESVAQLSASIFSTFDLEKTGWVSPAEVRIFLGHLGASAAEVEAVPLEKKEISPAELEALLAAALGEERAGSLAKELGARPVAGHISKLHSENRLPFDQESLQLFNESFKAIIEVFDANSDRRLSSKELDEFARGFPFKDQLFAAFKQLDEDADDHVSLNDFAALLIQFRAYK